MDKKDIDSEDLLLDDIVFKLDKEDGGFSILIKNKKVGHIYLSAISSMKGWLNKNFYEQKENLIGLKFGRLTVVKRSEGFNSSVWDCVCDCGGLKNEVKSRSLISGRAQSCKCMKDDKWDKQPFGIVPDVIIAERLNVTRERVRQQRNKRGIPKYKGSLVRRSPRGLIPLSELSEEEFQDFVKGVTKEKNHG